MDERDDSRRSGRQVVVETARGAKALINVVRAAIAAGLHGAVTTAAKESLPFLIKVVTWVVFFGAVLPMLVFTALPNIFFGYESSQSPTIVDMSEQALMIGGAYMSIDDFERTQMDAIVTSLVAEYEADGTKIDQINVTRTFDEEDLCWLIAINSVAYKQDLNLMDAAAIQELCSSRLKYTMSLSSLVSGEGEDALITRTLVVKFAKLDAEKLMDQLGFDKEAKTWAGALYETLVESDALDQYGDYFGSYRLDYGGDSTYNGAYEHGGAYDNGIDISQFTDPATKNNLDLAAYAIQAWENNWGYVWGTFGNVLTRSLLDYKLEQYPEGVGNYQDFIEKNWLGRRTTDCIGLIKGYGWLDTDTLTIHYGTNGMLDLGANQMYQSARVKGEMDTMPDVPGIAVWKSGHIGVYIGGGYVIEAMSTKRGVVKTELAGRGWIGWCEIPYINYIEEG